MQHPKYGAKITIHPPGSTPCGARSRTTATRGELEDLYLPFKPKRRTRATIARERGLEVTKVVVSESGASIYSASATAAREHPDLDVTVRGALSIARRLQPEDLREGMILEGVVTNVTRFGAFVDIGVH